MQFIVYHGIDVEHALPDYRQRYGSDPRAIIAHPKAQIAAPEGVMVERNGGCLTGEIWLPAPEAHYSG